MNRTHFSAVFSAESILMCLVSFELLAMNSCSSKCFHFLPLLSWDVSDKFDVVDSCLCTGFLPLVLSGLPSLPTFLEPSVFACLAGASALRFSSSILFLELVLFEFLVVGESDGLPVSAETKLSAWFLPSFLLLSLFFTTLCYTLKVILVLDGIFIC